MAGGIDWFRWHHGSVTDPKFALVARKAGARLGDVLTVWAFLLEQASASDDRGIYGHLDHEAIDLMLDLPEGQCARIEEAMAQRGLVGDGCIVSWEKRQPKRERPEDNSTERSRAFRAKQRQATPETSSATPCNATQRQETPRGEERREEKREIQAEPIGSDGEAVRVPDTRAELWRAGKSLLSEQGMPSAQCGTFVGRLVKDYGEEAVVAAVGAAVVQRPADAASFLVGACRGRGRRAARRGGDLATESARTTKEAEQLLGIAGDVIDA